MPKQTGVELPGEINDVREGDTLESIEGLFKGHVAGFESRRNRFGTIMHTRLPTSKFENAIDFGGFDNFSASAGEKGAFLQTLVTLLRAGETEQAYRIDMVLHVPGHPVIYQKEDYSGFLKALKKAASLAERLENNGLPARMLSVGLKKGEPGMMDIYIRPYETFDLIGVLKSSEEESQL